MQNQYHISIETNFSLIDSKQAFEGLNQKESLYSYNFAKASWNGAKICFFQRSYQSPAILYLILKAFEKQTSKQLEQKALNIIDQQQLKKIYIYIAAFLNNCGNFKSFGDSKFVPQCSQQKFKTFLLLSQGWKNNVQMFNQIYQKIRQFIFKYDKPYALIDFRNKDGTSGYYSGNISSDDAEKVKQITIKQGLMSQNNRLVKISQNQFILKVASIAQKQDLIINDGDIKITVKFGQFSPFLKLLNKYLTEANKYSANQIQQKMINQYIQHFQSGDMQKHKQSQKYWIKDIGPSVQTNIGFIQSYLDPLKMRAQFEGFVAIVNKQQSKLLNNLVQSAKWSLAYLPWGKQCQVQQFKKPDFTSLDVLAFASSGVPVGINIPNYHDIRQNFGFKNVNLANAYGQPSQKSLLFTPQKIIELCLKYYKPSLFVLVALHQLLGHGSGKLLNQKASFKNPFNQQEITTFYGLNQTYHSVFGQIASTYQQCKADSVGLYLSLFEDIQEILLPKFNKQQRWDIVYIQWFDLIISGLKGLVYFDVQGKKWLQAHVGASWAILQVLEEQGGIFQIKQTQKNGKPYLQVYLDTQAFKTKGKKAIGNFLHHLQFYKSTADSKNGIPYFQKYLQVHEKYLKYRQIVLANKRPRRIDIQADVRLNNGKVQYIRYQPNVYGCIDSGVAHFSQNVQDIINQWNKNNQQFKY